MNSRKIVLTIAFVVATAISTTKSAYAYVDPGSGTFLLQILAALGLGGAFYFRQAIDKIKSLFSSSPIDDPSAKDEQD